MDIDEMELRLLKAYDEIRAQNTQIEEETTALGEETKEAIDSIERDMSSYINDMQQQMNQLMSEKSGVCGSGIRGKIRMAVQIPEECFFCR